MMNPEIRALRTDLVKAKIARGLIALRVAPDVADEIAGTGDYGATADGIIIVDFAEGRATEDPQTIVAIVAQLVKRAAPQRPQRVVDKRTNVSGAF